MRYRKKRLDFEAWQVGSGKPYPDWLRGCLNVGGSVEIQADGAYVIHTPERDYVARMHDYIILTPDGKMRPCKPDIFEQTYEVVGE